MLWLLVALVLLFGVGSLFHSPVAEFGTPSFLIVSAIWLVGVVPGSFAVWLRMQHRHEQEVVAAALRSWREGAPNAGPLLGQAIVEALADEDEDALRRLLEVLKTTPGRVGPTLEPFMQAAHEWLSDDGGHSSRDAHLDRVREAARPVLAALS